MEGHKQRNEVKEYDTREESRKKEKSSSNERRPAYFGPFSAEKRLSPSVQRATQSSDTQEDVSQLIITLPKRTGDSPEGTWKVESARTSVVIKNV